MKILIVEDDENQREALRKLLRNRGFEVAEAEDAFQAMQIIFSQKEKEFDCIISDFFLRGKNGLEMLKKLREQMVDTPFILMTGSIDGDIEEISKQVSAKACLKKPFDIETLVAIIKK